jgi:Animal haem peroxidase
MHRIIGNESSNLRSNKPSNTSGHGGGVRGDDTPDGSPQFEGSFGRMFRTLPKAEFDVLDLEALATAMSAKAETDSTGTKPAAAKEQDDTAISRIDDPEENSGIDAGYTYLGQFIDHDMTLDPNSSMQKQNDPQGLVNFRTPRLDLDCLYGRGPGDQPYMYTGDGRKFLLGKVMTQGTQASTTFDLPRFRGDAPNSKARALIGDKRNDENVIVSQLQGAMLQFHNRLADDHADWSFAEVQRMVRWHYQYVVLHDFLPRMVGEPMMESILPHLKSGDIFTSPPRLRFYHPKHESFIPIEFSAAAYRFGHSMVRPIYRLNTNHQGGKDPQTATQDEIDRGLAGRFFIFAGVQARGLNGFDEPSTDFAIDWSLYFDINGSAAKVGKARLQPAYKLDTSLVNPLEFLPEFSADALSKGTELTLATLVPPEVPVTPKPIRNLGARNLKRGAMMGLPSGQDVARAMGVKPLADAELLIGKATHDSAFDIKTPVEQRNKSITKVSANFANNAPLWFYVLAEALDGWKKRVIKEGKEKKADEANLVPVMLGPVGGRIVAETIIGLMLGDSHSYLRQDPNWRPVIPVTGSKLRMGDLIKYGLRL